MSKKTIVSIIAILILAAGGFFCWWQNGAELRELNKNLPDGIRVVQRDGSQVIVNKKDGYEIKVPEGWGGLEKVEYIGGLTISSQNTDDWLSISSFEIEKNTELLSWVETQFKDSKGVRFSPFVTVLEEEKIENYKGIRVKDEPPEEIPGGPFFFYYIKKNMQIYEFYTDYSEQTIKDVILNGTF